MSEEKGLDTLQVWQRAMTFAIKVQQQILPLFPVDEKWALVTQLRRSVQSIPGNIAEGYGRYYYQESVRFCYIARGSLEESYTYLSLGNKLGYISENIFHPLTMDITDLRRLLNGYINFLKKSKRGENEPGSTHQTHEDSELYITDSDPDVPVT
jgi:four helix bundle protein